jgi:hypothetical protein
MSNSAVTDRRYSLTPSANPNGIQIHRRSNSTANYANRAKLKNWIPVRVFRGSPSIASATPGDSIIFARF